MCGCVAVIFRLKTNKKLKSLKQIVVFLFMRQYGKWITQWIRPLKWKKKELLAFKQHIVSAKK